MKTPIDFACLVPDGALRVQASHFETIERLKTFNRGLAHDLRGPLSGLAKVAGLSGEAMARGDIASATRMLSVIREQTGQLVDMVDSMFNLARADAKVLITEDVEIKVCVDEALELLRLCRVAAEPARPRLEVQMGPLPKVRADPALLRQVFFNLLSNAFKFSHGRADPSVCVKAFQSTNEVLIMVQDRGVGFDANRAKDLFQPFRRLHGGQFEGTGIGLYVVRHIVERHGGRIWACGRPNVGAAFIFTMPSASDAETSDPS